MNNLKKIGSRVLPTHYIYTLLVALMAVFATASCSDDNTSDLQLAGNCGVTAIALDDYDGTIDAAARSIVVRVPENYDTRSMTVTDLALSDGAESSVSKGDILDMSVAHTIHVTNGDVYLDWSLKAVRDEAKILSFKLNDTYVGSIDETAKTILVLVPGDTDVKQLVPTVTVSDGATVTPEPGLAVDFTNPVQFTVENNTAKAVYTVTVRVIDKPSAIFVGTATDQSGLNPEEAAACKWMTENVPNSVYVSFDAIQKGTVDLSECKLIWWHYHKDGGVDGKNAFEKAAPEAINAAAKLRDFYDAGGSFLLTRYATNLPAFIGAVKNDACPNNCWGGNEDSPEITGNPWNFFMNGNDSHAIYQNLIKGDDANGVYTCDTGYGITNSTAQWHIGSDWGGYADYATWRNETGAKDLGYGGDGAVVVWEFPKNGTKGGIICIGSGCYDWSTTTDVSSDKYHKNVETMTQNAINYLMGK